MAIQTLQDKGSSFLVQSSYDGAVYRLMSDDCVLKGIGNEFELVENVNYSSSSLDITFEDESEALLCGNFFKLTSSITHTLPANSTVYLCARIDTSKANGSKGSFENLTASQIVKGNINSNDTIRDMLLYIITTNANGVVSVEDKRIVKELGGSNVIKGTLYAGNTTITISDASIQNNSILSFYTSIYGVNPTSVAVNNGSVVLTFIAQATNMVVGVKVEGSY